MKGIINRVNNSRLSKLSALLCGLLLASAVQAQTKTIYRETFNYCTGTLGKDAATEANWVGLVSGLPQAKISNLKVVSYGTLDIGGSVNSNPIGLAQGYGFWFKPVYGLTLITAEFQFDVGVLRNSETLIQYRQRLSGIDPLGQTNKTHLAILVDNVWYISNEAAQQQQPGVWEAAQLAPGAITYVTVPYVAGIGPTRPALFGTPAFGAPLPLSGTVRAFGVYLDEVNGRVRLDNFMIKGLVPSGSSISDVVQDPDVSLCPESSPDRTGGGGSPTPPPDEDDGDSSSDRFVPDPVETPTPTPTAGPIQVHGSVYQFCALSEQGIGRKVAISTRARAAIAKKIGTTTLADLRDRAIVALLAQRPLPLGALVNIKRGDFNDAQGVVTVATRKVAMPMRFRLRGAALSAMKRYLKHPLAPKDITAPLFVDLGLDNHALHLSTQRALCLADMRAILKARMRQAKLRKLSAVSQS